MKFSNMIDNEVFQGVKVYVVHCNNKVTFLPQIKLARDYEIGVKNGLPTIKNIRLAKGLYWPGFEKKFDYSTNLFEECLFFLDEEEMTATIESWIIHNPSITEDYIGDDLLENISPENKNILVTAMKNALKVKEASDYIAAFNIGDVVSYRGIPAIILKYGSQNYFFVNMTVDPVHEDDLQLICRVDERKDTKEERC